MARYIDADALLSKMPDDLPYKASVKRVLMQAPEADVVPKIEVEKIFEEIDRKIISDIDQCNWLLVEFDSADGLYQQIKGEVSALLQMQDFIDCLKTKYKEGKMKEHDATELAFRNGYAKAVEDIFGEIEMLAKTYTFPVVKCGVIEIVKEPFWCIEPNDYEKLKKKYMGE